LGGGHGPLPVLLKFGEAAGVEGERRDGAWQLLPLRELVARQKQRDVRQFWLREPIRTVRPEIEAEATTQSPISSVAFRFERPAIRMYRRTMFAFAWPVCRMISLSV